MPWRGPDPEHPHEFPTLGHVVCDWIEAYCVIPDGEDAGKPFLLPAEQERFILNYYRLRPDATPGKKPRAAFRYRRGALYRPQKWGKGPLSSAMILAEAHGPVVFDGWDADGEPVGRPWATPWIQVVAVSEDQTDNVWTALVPMIELGDLAAEIPDTGKTRVNIIGAHGSRGLIEPVTSAAVSRLGQRITFAVHDETHSWTPLNGGVKLADVQRRNLAGMGGRALETSNAYDPAEQSVAQQTHEASRELDDVLVDFPDTPSGSIRNARDRRRMLRAVYSGAPWVDLDGIDAEIVELLMRDPAQAERFYLNRVQATASAAFDLEAFVKLGEPGRVIEPGRLVTLGFDGARRQDATALVATDVELGFQQTLGVWEHPLELDPETSDWEVDEADVRAAVEQAFDEFDVWRLYADPPYWETATDDWAGTYGDKRVVRWWTNRTRAMAYAVRAYTEAIGTGAVTHDGHDALVRHVGNAVKRPTRIRVPETGAFLHVIGKEGAKSRRKIDAAMAAVLSWEARGDAIRDGALKRAEYGRAAW